MSRSHRGHIEVRTQTLPVGFVASIGAAVLLLVVALSFDFGVRWTTGSSEVQHYRTLAGQQSTVRLADGSTITLAPATTVALTDRSADVIGSAYFSLVSHPIRPFVVRTHNAVVRVLGTRFMVRQYAGDMVSRVVVEEGKVAVQSRQRRTFSSVPVALSAYMMAQVSDSTVTVSSNIKTGEYTSWVQGLLMFHGVALHDAVIELAHAYNVDIQVDDSVLAAQRLRMDVSVANDTLIQVLDDICSVADAHVIQRGRGFVLIPGRATSRHQQFVPQHQRLPQPEQQYGR